MAWPDLLDWPNGLASLAFWNEFCHTLASLPELACLAFWLELLPGLAFLPGLLA